MQCSLGSAARTAALVIAAALLAACTGDDAAPPSRAGDDSPIGDVLLVTIDTARQDRFSYAGGTTVSTPVIDALAADGVALVGAVSPVPVTLPAHASLLTGKIPPRHGARSNALFRLDDEHATLAELLRPAGFRTAAFIGASVLARRYGLDQGFDHYDDRVDPSDDASSLSFAQRRANIVVQETLRWLEANPDERTFVWVHLYDPHAPYDPPEPERSRFADNPYDGEIAYVDRMLGRLLDGYRRFGRADRALVVVTSDHGESLGEHGEATHGMFLFDATARVPLVIRAPGLARGTVLHDQVSLVDVLPTTLDLLGQALPSDLDGVSLAAALRGETRDHTERLAYLETLYPRLHHGWAESRALRSARWKLVEGARLELFDLENNPGELVNLVDRQPQLTAEWRARLADLDRADSPNPAVNLQPDAETRRQLASLGYIAGRAGSSDAPASELPDPRDRMHLLDEMNEALTLWSRDQRGAAMRRAEQVVEAEPDSAFFVRQLANMYLSEEQMADASRLYRRAVELAPSDVDSWANLGVALHAGDLHDQALEALDTALAIDPADRASRHSRWSVLLALGQGPRVTSEASSALTQDPSDGEAHWALLQSRPPRDPRELAAALERALEQAPGDPTLALELGKLQEAAGDLPRAEHNYRTAFAAPGGPEEATFRVARLLVLTSRHAEAGSILHGASHVRRTPELLYLLSEIRYQMGDAQGAIAALQETVRRAPERADAWATLAMVLLRQGDEAAARDAYEQVLALGLDDPFLRSQLGDGKP